MVDLKQHQHQVDIRSYYCTSRVHELNAGYNLNRFNTGHLLDEKGLGTKTWIS